MPTIPEGKAAQTRRDILAKAVDLASVDGLSGLTVGRLASATSMSKSGLFAHFGSKEDLQLAVVEAASELFASEVLEQLEENPIGLGRLLSMVGGWLGHLERGVFRGGCFFAAVSAEVDDKPGRVRDRVVELTRSWLERLESEAERAVEARELAPDSDPALLAFEIHAFVQEANWSFQLHGNANAFRLARRAIQRTLSSCATEAGRETLDAARSE